MEDISNLCPIKKFIKQKRPSARDRKALKEGTGKINNIYEGRFANLYID